jgi:hypothetical protein
VNYPHSKHAHAVVAASPAALFAHLDDQANLGAHMEKPSMMMLGGRMSYELDAAKGQAVGSVIKMHGRVLGIGLELEEVVIERTPPARKLWETRGRLRLLVIGPYRMGFDVEAAGTGAQVHVFIDYTLPQTGISRLLGALLGHWYANWCVRRMAGDATRRFSPTAANI